MSGKFAYAVNNAAPGSVSQYAVDATSGALTSLATAAVTAGNSPISISLDTTGAYAYVVNSGDATVSQFKISADGSLTPLTTPTIETGKSPSALAISPTGKAAYLTNAGDANVSQYAIVDGALSPMTAATVASGTNPVAITIDPLGTHAYVVNNGGNTVSQYTLDPTTGALSSMSTATVITEAGPNSVIVDPTGQYAYVTNTTGDSVSQFTLGSDGALSANAPPRVPAQMSPGGMAMVGGSVPTRAVAEYAYVANGGDTLSLYTIGTSGTLTALDTMTVTGTGPTSIAVDPSGKHAYVTNSNADTVSQYSIDTTGRLVALTPLAVAAKAVPTAIAIRPSGKYAYVMNQVDRSLSQYSIATDGTFSPLARASIKVTTTGGPNSMAIDSSGRFLYVSITNGTLAQFAIGIDGLVSALSPATVSVGTSPTGVCISPSGKYLYMANSSNNELWQFSIGATGTLTPLNPTTIAAGTQPAAIALDATGKYAYAANMKTADISQYAVSDSGALTALATAKVPAGVAGTDSPYWIAIDSSGQFAYVVNDRVSGGGVWQYSLGANGSLTALVDKAQRSGPVGALGCPFFDVTAAHARAVASGDPLVGLTPEIPRNTGNGCPSTHHVRRHAVVSSCRQCP